VTEKKNAEAAGTEDPTVSGASSTPAEEDSAAAAGEDSSGSNDAGTAASTDGGDSSSEADAGADSAGGNDPAEAEGEGTSEEAEEVTVDDVTKKSLVQHAADLQLDTSGTKAELAQRIVDSGAELRQPKGINGCVTDELCIRPAHTAVPDAHSYGQTTAEI
jgi:hypothetical protein